MTGTDVVVVGGGAAGCAAAYFLSKGGAKVTLIEREAIASHSSGFAFGALIPQHGAGIPGPVLPLARVSFQMHEQLADELRENSGVDTHFRRQPTLIVAFTQEEVNKAHQDIAWQQAEGFSTRWLDADQVREIEKRISPEALGAQYLERTGSLDSYRYVLALVQAAEKNGATVRHGTVVGLRRRGERVAAVALEGEDVPCDVAVIALGPWSGAASEWLGFPLPIEPVKGQLIQVQAEGAPLACCIGWSGNYAESKPDGLVWAGTTEEWVGFDEAPTPEGRAQVMEGLLRVLPALADARLVQHTACLRPLSTDLLPIIGPAPGWQGVYLATGGGRKGILLSPAMGRIVTDLVVHGETVFDLTAVSPQRFVGANPTAASVLEARPPVGRERPSLKSNGTVQPGKVAERMGMAEQPVPSLPRRAQPAPGGE